MIAIAGHELYRWKHLHGITPGQIQDCEWTYAPVMFCRVYTLCVQLTDISCSTSWFREHTEYMLRDMTKTITQYCSLNVLRSGLSHNSIKKNTQQRRPILTLRLIRPISMLIPHNQAN